MSNNDLYNAFVNYLEKEIINESCHVIARKKGEVIFDDFFKIKLHCETNYHSIDIDWSEEEVLPFQYRYPSFYDVQFKYYSNVDKLIIKGEFHNDEYEIEVQLPPKRNF